MLNIPYSCKVFLAKTSGLWREFPDNAGISVLSACLLWLTLLTEALFAFRAKMHLILSPVSSSKHRCNCTHTALRLPWDWIAQTAFRRVSDACDCISNVTWKQGPWGHFQLCTTRTQHDKLFVCGREHGQCFEVDSWGEVWTAFLLSVAQHKCVFPFCSSCSFPQTKSNVSQEAM